MDASLSPLAAKTDPDVAELSSQEHKSRKRKQSAPQQFKPVQGEGDGKNEMGIATKSSEGES